MNERPAHGNWKTRKYEYQLVFAAADTDDKIGVTTTCCEGFNKCPDALNRV